MPAAVPIALEPLVLPDEADAVVAFLRAHTWPFHVGSALTEAQARRRASEVYVDDDHEPLWITHPEHGRIGLAVLEDLTDDAPLFDLRLAADHRGHGYGRAALAALATWTFTRYPAVHRLEGATRSDNAGMRRAFDAAGFVHEATYRQAWPTADGELLDSVAYALLRPDWESGRTTAPLAPTGTPHHVELWVPDLARARTAWGTLLGALGYRPFQEWPDGVSWRLGPTYIVLEQSPAMLAGGHDRHRPGLNHLALHVATRGELDAVVRLATAAGWSHLHPDRHPDGGGAAYEGGVYAAYLLDADGFEVELVAR
ncbi:GNAT family N-acetyltransferase [Serinibacter arcticus]|uniref:GNAT family N-acetyltransferase n=1 Tax=Serinibacter arcticus TaxID=1655435 RepID=A0A2U1ZXU0_9MICO|nr:GNAT family N-acetyltransferase [Serinibacter arcticus]PWD51791.1 GNAT family N-acetyltransferase [Serinibacter arcticus]